MYVLYPICRASRRHEFILAQRLGDKWEQSGSNAYRRIGIHLKPQAPYFWGRGRFEATFGCLIKRQCIFGGSPDVLPDNLRMTLVAQSTEQEHRGRAGGFDLHLQEISKEFSTSPNAVPETVRRLPDIALAYATPYCTAFSLVTLQFHCDGDGYTIPPQKRMTAKLKTLQTPQVPVFAELRAVHGPGGPRVVCSVVQNCEVTSRAQQAAGITEVAQVSETYGYRRTYER